MADELIKQKKLQFIEKLCSVKSCICLVAYLFHSDNLLICYKQNFQLCQFNEAFRVSSIEHFCSIQM